MVIILAYLSGSIPMGYLIARLYGVDVTAAGSGRTGGTNVLRAAGGSAAGLTVFGDVMKGLVPVFILDLMAPHIIPSIVVALAAAATVLGHNYSIFLKFRGGVGAGTAIGALGGLSFWIGVLATGCALTALALTRYASMLSTAVAVSGVIFLIIFAVLGFVPYAYILAGILIAALIVYALRPNYAQIRAGTERKVGQKSDTTAKAAP